jgi:uncharacterized membrane protein
MNTMIALEEKSELDVRSGYEAQLTVERMDISFQDVPGNRVRISVTVHNTGARRSRPTPMRLESAPLGAFVPWQPLAVLTIPVLEPGESRELSTEVARPRLASLGDIDRVPPKRLLTAVNSPDQSGPPRSRLGKLLLFQPAKRLVRRAPLSTVSWTTTLAPDLMDLMGRGQPHWAGNINVFIGRQTVERHRAKALRIYPGRTNVAMFIVGDWRKRDAFSFELAGVSAAWKAFLYDVTHRTKLAVDPSQAPIQETQWVESGGGLMVTLAVQPPPDARTGNVEVHVTRRSCGKTAVVEFNLDSTAQGPGCYVATA